MNSWVAIATTAGIVSVTASAVAIGTLAVVVRRWGAVQGRASGEPVQRGLLLAEEAEDLAERLRALAHDLEVEAHYVAAASKGDAAAPAAETHPQTPSASRRS